MNKTALIIVLVLAGVLGVWYFMSQPTTPAPVGEEVEDTKDGDVTEEEDTSNTVTLTNAGFAPSVLTVDVGDTVKFVNNSDSPAWPASAVHPTHEAYPGSGIVKCATAVKGVLFDACGAIAPGGSWEFTFNVVGEWGYHDHLNAKSFGKVVVE